VVNNKYRKLDCRPKIEDKDWWSECEGHPWDLDSSSKVQEST
jgi:hypothetical protein